MNPADLDGLPEADKEEMMSMIEGMQTRDSLKMYNGLVERCFKECVDSFRRKNLDSTEERCLPPSKGEGPPPPPPRPNLGRTGSRPIR